MLHFIDIDELIRNYDNPLGEEMEVLLALAEEMKEGEKEGIEFGGTVFRGCLLVRIHEEDVYLFSYPFPLTEDADESAALLALSHYSRREMLPLKLSEVPREALDILRELFPHFDAYAYEFDEDSFFVRVNNEIDMLDDFPTLEGEGLMLSEIKKEDMAAYKRLCEDRELNRYWGYDVYEDTDELTEDYLYGVVVGEFNTGVALSLAIRLDGALIGEATVYNCDYRGGAEIALRILPEHHGKGLGKRALSLLIELCRKIGVSDLRARVMTENIYALKMTDRYMSRVCERDGEVLFELSL